MKKRTTKLSNDRIATLKWSNPRPYYDVWDKECRGLFIRVGKTTKTFYVYDSPTRKTTKIGRWGMINAKKNEAIIGLIEVEHARELVKGMRKDKRVLTNVSVKKMILSDYLASDYQLERNSQGRTLRERTLKSLRSNYRDWLDCKIEDISEKMMLQKLQDWQQGTHQIDTSHPSRKHVIPKPNKDSTRRKNFVEMNAVFNHLVKMGYIHKNPFYRINIKQPKAPDQIHVYDEDTVTYAGVMDFILNQNRPSNGNTSKYRKDHRKATRLLIATIIRLGLRDSEARRNYIYNFVTDKEFPYLRIPAEISKTGKSRDVPIADPILLKAIIDYKQNGYIATKNPEQLMFFNPRTGKELTHSAGRSLFKEIKARFKLGINGNGSGKKYDFRHTFATRIYQSTGDIKLTADLIGDDIKTANDYYAKPDRVKAWNAVQEVK